MIIGAVLSITILYFLLAIFSDFIKKIVGKKICAICAAVSLTWASLLILKLLGFDIEALIIAILMGQSIVGLVDKLEDYFKKKNLPRFWLVRILIITGGTLFVYWLLKENYILSFLLLLLGVLLLPAIVLSASPKKMKKNRRPEDFKKAAQKLEKMMEECC